MVHYDMNKSTPEQRAMPANNTEDSEHMPSGGLTGRAARIANLSAVAFVLVLLSMMYVDFRSSVREERAALREELQYNRVADRENVDRLTKALEQNTRVVSQLAKEHNALMWELRKKVAVPLPPIPPEHDGH